MQYRPKSKNKKNIFTLVVIGLFVLILLIRLIVPSFVDNLALFIASPFIKGSTYLSFVPASVFTDFMSKNDLQNENQKLKDQIQQMQVSKDQNDLLVQENTDLKELLGRHSKSTSILATVIAKPPISLYDTLLVDVGSSDNVTTGDKVLALGTVPIGTIDTVYAHSSLVKLYSSPGEQINVSVGKNIETTADSQGGGSFILKLPKDTALYEGEPVFAPGISVNIFGVVEKIETNENDPFVYAHFNLPVNIVELNFVQIDRENIP